MLLLQRNAIKKKLGQYCLDPGYHKTARKKYTVKSKLMYSAGRQAFIQLNSITTFQSEMIFPIYVMSQHYIAICSAFKGKKSTTGLQKANNECDESMDNCL